MGSAYSDDEDVLILVTEEQGYHGFRAAGGTRSYDSYQKRRRYLNLECSSLRPSLTNPSVLHRKKLGFLDWRETVQAMQRMQDLKAGNSETQQTTDIYIDSDVPIVVMALGDTHLGSWSTDYDAFMRVTEEILSIPELYVVLLGDMAHMAIKLRSVEETSDNLLPPDMQLALLREWIAELAPQVLACVWGNHEVEREEAQAGGSRFADLYKRTAVYFGGIGHADVTVGSQSYRIAVSHKFPGRSEANPVYGPQKYLLQEGTDRDIAMAGDSHRPGMLKFTHGPNVKLAVNCGSTQTMSGYARRYFSLKTHPVFPVFTLNPERKLFTPYWSVEEYLYRR